MSKSMATDEGAIPPDAVSATRVSEKRLLGPGQEVLEGRFRVRSLLGVGGMGEVYEAEQVSLGRLVALKVLNADMSLVAGMAERFRREALLLSSVDHPAVVRIIDFGEWNGAACLVMELVRGESLELLARGGPMPQERAVPMLVQLAEGLAAIHAKGIVHRDLKLENVLVSVGTAGEQARLLDFGIARLAEAPGVASATQAGVVLGTPEYMSPEQALGRPLDARSDIYAWGVLAHRLLAGAHPFPGPSARDFILQHISAKPAQLEGVRPEIAQLVERCLEKEPGARPTTAVELVEALHRRPAVPIPLVNEAPSSLAPVVAAATRTAEWAAGAARRRPARAAAIAAAVLAIGLSVTLVRACTSSPEREASEQLARGDARGALATLRLARAGGGLDANATALEARALHQLGRHDEEWSALAELPAPSLDAVTAADVRNLLEDFGRDEKARELHEQLNRLAQRHFETLKEAAELGERNIRWGAVRYLDAWGQASESVVLGYSAALEDDDCHRRAAAAKRLGDLGDGRAVAELERLKAEPRKRTFLFEENCGQNEAAQALKKLGKKPGR